MITPPSSMPKEREKKKWIDLVGQSVHTNDDHNLGDIEAVGNNSIVVRRPLLAGVHILNYPPQLLTRYQHDIILKTLLFQYFEVETIEGSTACFYSVITRYLQECCRMTLQRGDVVKKSTTGTPIPMNVKEAERHTKILQSDLQWHAKVIAFKLAHTCNSIDIFFLLMSAQDSWKSVDSTSFSNFT
jgi:hypothetical protein